MSHTHTHTHTHTPVAFGVHRHDIHGNVVLLARVQVAHFDAHGWKHPPEGTRGESLLKLNVNLQSVLGAGKTVFSRDGFHIPAPAQTESRSNNTRRKLFLLRRPSSEESSGTPRGHEGIFTAEIYSACSP